MTNERLSLLRQAYRTAGRGEGEWADGTDESRQVADLVRARMASRQARPVVFASFSLKASAESPSPQPYRYRLAVVRFADLHVDVKPSNVVWAKGTDARFRLNATGRLQLPAQRAKSQSVVAKSAAPTRHALHAMALTS
jgi:hypothetical protein